MTSTKLLRGVAALGLLALAAPALPCGDAKSSTATKDGVQTAPKDAVASKTGEKAPVKGKTAQPKPATAAN